MSTGYSTHPKARAALVRKISLLIMARVTFIPLTTLKGPEIALTKGVVKSLVALQHVRQKYFFQFHYPRVEERKLDLSPVLEDPPSNPGRLTLAGLHVSYQNPVLSEEVEDLRHIAGQRECQWAMRSL